MHGSTRRMHCSSRRDWMGPTHWQTKAEQVDGWPAAQAQCSVELTNLPLTPSRPLSPPFNHCILAPPTLARTRSHHSSHARQHDGLLERSTPNSIGIEASPVVVFNDTEAAPSYLSQRHRLDCAAPSLPFTAENSTTNTTHRSSTGSRIEESTVVLG